LIGILLLVACFISSVMLQLTPSLNSREGNLGSTALPVSVDIQERVQDNVGGVQNAVQESATEVATREGEVEEAAPDAGDVRGLEETEATRSIWVARVIENSNLRRGPGTAFDVVGSATVGTELNVYGRTSDGWLQVDETGETWIGITRVELEVDAVAIPTVVFSIDP
jgi:hypothetical protein